MTRTFIALELDESLQDYLGGIIRQMAQELPRLNWVKPTGIHLTLAFLGDLTDERLAEAIQIAELAAQEVSPFEYHLTHLGMFGSWDRPRVVWMGVAEPSGKLLQLHRILNRELRQRGFEIDPRPLSPHLTLARIKTSLKSDEQQRLQRLLAEIRVPTPASRYFVSQLSVMKSELLRSGAKYTCLQNCVLKEEHA